MWPPFFRKRLISAWAVSISAWAWCKVLNLLPWYKHVSDLPGQCRPKHVQHIMIVHQIITMIMIIIIITVTITTIITITTIMIYYCYNNSTDNNNNNHHHHHHEMFQVVWLSVHPGTLLVTSKSSGFSSLKANGCWISKLYQLIWSKKWFPWYLTMLLTIIRLHRFSKCRKTKNVPR